VDLLIGSLPLRISSQDSSLLSAASKRYRGFGDSQEKRFSIQVDRAETEFSGQHEFACDFEGARVVATPPAPISPVSGMNTRWILFCACFSVGHCSGNKDSCFMQRTVVRNGKAYVFVAGPELERAPLPRSARVEPFDRRDFPLEARGPRMARVGTPFWAISRGRGKHQRASRGNFSPGSGNR